MSTQRSRRAPQRRVAPPESIVVRDAPSRDTPAHLRAGNAAAVALLSRVQPKLTVGAAADEYEREADRVAAQVVEVLESGRGGVDAAEAASVGRVRRRSTVVDASGGDLDEVTTHDIAAARSGGAPLPAAVRAPMEGAFGADFSDVRVHTGARSTELNERIQARAFTLGRDVFFSGPMPDASSPGGRELLAHELTHTLQQRGGSNALQRWPFERSDKDKEKAKAKQAKGKKVATAKSQEKAEKQRLAAEREVGKKHRATLKEQYQDDPDGLRALGVAFDKALEDESALRRQLVATGKSDELAETEAYRRIWLDALPALRALRPIRETRAEKLVADTSATRSDIGAHETSKAGVKEIRGALLSKKVEDLFVKEVELVNQMLALKVPLDEARDEAYEMVWPTSDPELLAKRPARGSKLEDAAYDHAAKRARRMAVEKSDGTDVVGKLGTASSAGGGVMTGTGAIGKVTKLLTDDGNKSTLSTGEKAGGGIDTISSLVTGVLSTVSGIAEFVELVSTLIKQDSVDYNDVANAIQAGLNEVKGLSSNVQTGMRVAQSLNESALASLAGVIPIVDVITNSIGVAANLAEAFPNAVRYGTNLADVYVARGADRPELVLIGKRLGQRNVQLLEQSLYKTTSSLTKLMLGIAQLASGGADMGATTAIKLSITVVDAVHGAAHTIADNVFAVQAKSARKQYIGPRAEGSAEALLRRDAGFAVDALLTAAVKGDATTKKLAAASLKNGYGVELKSGDAGELTVARERIFKILGEGADPKTTLDGLKDGVAKLQQKTEGWSNAATDVATLARARSAQDGKQRDFRWKMKMWFKSDGALARRIAQHNAQHGTALDTGKQQRSKGFTSTGADPMITQPKVQQTLIDQMDGMTSKDLLIASKDTKRSQFERIVFGQAYAVKLQDELAGQVSAWSAEWLAGAVESYLAGNGWPHERLSDDPDLDLGTTPVFLTTVRSGDDAWPVVVAVGGDDGDYLIVQSLLPVTVPDGDEVPAIEMICRLNDGMVDGCVEMNFDDGTIRLRSSVPVGALREVERDVVEALVEDVVELNVEAAAFALPGLRAVILDRIAPGRAILRLEADDQS